MEIKVSLDWIRYSAPAEYPHSLIIPEMFTCTSDDNELKPLPNYTQARRIYPAGRLDWNDSNSKQGSLVTFGGRDLIDIRNEDIEAEYILAYAHKRKWLKASRIDLAVDIFNRVAHPLDILDAWNEGRVKTHAGKCQAIQSHDAEGNFAGETVYIGSRTSDTFLRAYDKGKEQKSDELWTRIELELKKQQARQAQAKIPAVGLQSVIADKIASYVQISGVQWWTEMLSNLPLATGIMKGERKQKPDNGDKWLMTQALPAVCKAIEGDNQSVIDVILQTLISRGNKGSILQDSE